MNKEKEAIFICPVNMSGPNRNHRVYNDEINKKRFDGIDGIVVDIVKEEDSIFRRDFPMIINRFALYHYDDGKGEKDSHRVKLFEDDSKDEFFNQPVFSSREMVGYGENYDKALDDLLEKIRERIINLEAFCTMCECTDVIKPKKVDCFDKIIKNQED